MLIVRFPTTVFQLRGNLHCSRQTKAADHLHRQLWRGEAQWIDIDIDKIWRNEMSTIETTALAPLDKEGRLLNAVFKGPTPKPGYFGFRGDIALKFQTQLADEKRPPEYSLEAVAAVTKDGESTIPVLIGYLHNFAHLKDVVDIVGPVLNPAGTYFMYCNNIDLLAKYKVKLGGIPFFILPLDESTVWKEAMDLVSLDKNDVKKLDLGGKLQALMDKTIGFDDSYDEKTYEDVLAVMEPVKNRNENRPV
jgi:hypothetical protein